MPNVLNILLRRYLVSNDQRHASHNSQKMKTAATKTHLFVNREVDEENVVDIYREILFIHKEK